MPANVSWGRYLTFATAAMLSMMAGSQFVHVYYKPMSDFDQYLEAEKNKMNKIMYK